MCACIRVRIGRLETAGLSHRPHLYECVPVLRVRPPNQLQQMMSKMTSKMVTMICVYAGQLVPRRELGKHGTHRRDHAHDDHDHARNGRDDGLDGACDGGNDGALYAAAVSIIVSTGIGQWQLIRTMVISWFLSVRRS